MHFIHFDEFDACFNTYSCAPLCIAISRSFFDAE